ncbi:MAG: hypothetical protein ACSHYA_14095 [Opitutaceae bacterium]
MKLQNLLYTLTLAIAANLVAAKPNIVFVLCDDLGYGDVQCLNPENGKIPTPAVDRLASEGSQCTALRHGKYICGQHSNS